MLLRGRQLQAVLLLQLLQRRLPQEAGRQAERVQRAQRRQPRLLHKQVWGEEGQQLARQHGAGAGPVRSLLPRRRARERGGPRQRWRCEQLL